MIEKSMVTDTRRFLQENNFNVKNDLNVSV